MHFLKTLLRFFFKLLYHQFAFAYDIVATTVSIGRWNDWVSSIFPFIRGTRVLEIGFGPGHLQRLLLNSNLIPVGIDESAPMTRIAQRNIARGTSSIPKYHNATQTRQPAYTHSNLTRGLAQQLPFCDRAFETIVATFPAEYITDLRTLLEVRRCLSDGGRFIVLPVAMQMGRGMLERLMSLLFRVTRQTPTDPIDEVKAKLKTPFIEAGFEVDIQEIQVKSSLLLIILATRKEK